MEAVNLQPGFSSEQLTKPKPYDVMVRNDPSAGISHSIHKRDNGTCRVCGFACDKFMQVAANCEEPVSASDYYTLCGYCWQIANLDIAAIQSSAQIVWMPELSQQEINRHMPALYAERVRRGTQLTEVIHRILEIGKARREQASEKIGAAKSADLQELIYSVGTSLPEKLTEGFRIWPVDQWLTFAGSMKFNQFPQILAYWRSKNGPYPQGCKRFALTAEDWLTRLKN